MKRQKNMIQMKEQDENPGKEVNEIEISNKPDKEFKLMAIKILTKLEVRVELSKNIKR